VLAEMRLATSMAGEAALGQSRAREGGLLAWGRASRLAGICIPPLSTACVCLFAAIPGKVGIAAHGRVPGAPPWCYPPPASISPEIINHKISAVTWSL